MNRAASLATLRCWLRYVTESTSNSKRAVRYEKSAGQHEAEVIGEGGIREALKMVKLARREKLLVWIGIMISSSLGSNVPAQLLHAADLGQFSLIV